MNKTVYFRAFEPDDVKLIHQWKNSDELNELTVGLNKKTSMEDERVNMISLTDKGNELGEKMVQYSLKIVMRLIDEIGTDEIDRFIMTLLKIKDVLVDVTPCCNEEV